jgi:hypothetical protein
MTVSLSKLDLAQLHERDLVPWAEQMAESQICPIYRLKRLPCELRNITLWLPKFKTQPAHWSARKLSYQMKKLTESFLLSSLIATLSTPFFSIKPSYAQNQSMSVDEMAIVLGTYITVSNGCPSNFQGKDDAPLSSIVSQYGYKLVDFSPNGRYGQLVEFHMEKAIEFLKSDGNEKACPAMRDTVIQYLPELYR